MLGLVAPAGPDSASEQRYSVLSAHLYRSSFTVMRAGPVIVKQVKVFRLDTLRVRLLQSCRVQRPGHQDRIICGESGSPDWVSDHEGWQPVLTIEIPKAIVADEGGLFYRVIDERNGAHCFERLRAARL